MAQKVNPVDVDSEEADEIRSQFSGSVNMTAKELERWLAGDRSKSVGQKDGGESTGHESGRRIVAILEKSKGELTGEDVGHMKKVNAYVSRHLKQRPEGDVEDTPWRYSLMNWGHDPLK